MQVSHTQAPPPSAALEQQQPQQQRQRARRARRAAAAPLLALALLCCACRFPAAVRAQAFDLRGKVGFSADGLNILAPKPGTPTELVLSDADGVRARTFAGPDGWFTLHGVPPGQYVLATTNTLFIYPDLALDVAPKAGLTRAALVYNRAPVSAAPLLVRPAAQAHYFEQRKPIDVWGFVKSPMGLMLVFMLVMLFVFPALQVDPEEYREELAKMRALGGGGGGAQEGGAAGAAAGGGGGRGGGRSGGGAQQRLQR